MMPDTFVLPSACVREPEKQPLSSIADGLKVIEYLSSVKRWAKQGTFGLLHN
jgi:hypothetical protein